MRSHVQLHLPPAVHLHGRTNGTSLLYAIISCLTETEHAGASSDTVSHPPALHWSAALSAVPTVSSVCHVTALRTHHVLRNPSTGLCSIWRISPEQTLYPSIIMVHDLLYPTTAELCQIMQVVADMSIHYTYEIFQ